MDVTFSRSYRRKFSLTPSYRCYLGWALGLGVHLMKTNTARSEKARVTPRLVSIQIFNNLFIWGLSPHLHSKFGSDSKGFQFKSLLYFFLL